MPSEHTGQYQEQAVNRQPGFRQHSQEQEHSQEQDQARLHHQSSENSQEQDQARLHHQSFEPLAVFRIVKSMFHHQHDVLAIILLLIEND
jgi:protein required for attachment to host cells